MRSRFFKLLLFILFQTSFIFATNAQQSKIQKFTITIWDTLPETEIDRLNSKLEFVQQPSDALKILKREKTFGEVRILIIISMNNETKPWLPAIRKKTLEKSSYTYHLSKGGTVINSLTEFKQFFADTLLMISRTQYPVSFARELKSDRFYLHGECGGQQIAKVYLGYTGETFIVNPYFFSFCKQQVMPVQIYNDGNPKPIASCWFRLQDQDMKAVILSYYGFLIRQKINEEKAAEAVTLFCNGYYGKIKLDQVKLWLSDNYK